MRWLMSLVVKILITFELSFFTYPDGLDIEVFSRRACYWRSLNVGTLVSAT